MKSKLLLLNFNNYQNRKIKILDTKQQYLQFGIEYAPQSLNFIINDGVNTKQIVNLDLLDMQPDYLVVLDEFDNIKSRWFIIESIRTRQGQHELYLRRDVIADFYNEIINANAFIERGYIDETAPDVNPLIFNKEFLKFNEIKKQEIRLANNVNTPYIVIYLARTKGDGTAAEYNGEFNYDNIKYKYSFNYHTSYTGATLPVNQVQPITDDCEYEIIAIPYTDKNIKYNRPDGTGNTATGMFKQKALIWASMIAAKYSAAGFCYDIQLVPYTDLEGVLVDNNTISYIQKVFKFQSIELLTVEDGVEKTNMVAFKLRKSKFEINISALEMTPNKFINYGTLKKSNQLDIFRITSPNGVGNFDYSPAKNKWNQFNVFNIDCTLKPITPYIKISPIFNPNGLYGSDFDDYRGLICNGNFSLTILNNQWLTYELNNKNYQTMFNREIETLDDTNDIAKMRDIANAVGGSVGGAASGALSGGLIGGPIGAVIGGVVGGAASAGAGAADVLLNERERELNKQLKIDTFAMQLDNVKSRAVGLTRSTIFNKNNKIFPYIEYYTCTPQESAYFDNYIKIKGYKLGIVDTIKKYLNPKEMFFIQGSIIDIDIKEDYHIVNAINDYLEMGFRIQLRS